MVTTGHPSLLSNLFSTLGPHPRVDSFPKGEGLWFLCLRTPEDCLKCPPYSSRITIRDVPEVFMFPLNFALDILKQPKKEYFSKASKLHMLPLSPSQPQGIQALAHLIPWSIVFRVL